MSEIANLKPEAIWRNFDALTQVPRPSGHVEKVQQLCQEGWRRGFSGSCWKYCYAQTCYTRHGEQKDCIDAGSYGYGSAKSSRQQTQF